MNVKLLIAFVIFLFVSYTCFIRFSESIEEQLVKHLQQHFDDVECPSGISLYRLQRNGILFRLQIQSRLPQSPNVKQGKIRRCEAANEIIAETEITDVTKHSETCNKDSGRDDSRDDEIRNCSISSGYYDMDSLTSRFLYESCEDKNYDAEECMEGDEDQIRCTNGYRPSRGIMSYLPTVVKGPADFETEDYKTRSEIWSIETLTRGIFPGTLWCGFGNIADDTFGKLGEHSETDDCCRSHDLCKPIIKAFQTRYWYSNPSFVPISHCACDMEFYKCLTRVNSPTSKMIGKIFFNLVKMKCFDFDVREVCSSSFMGLCMRREDKCVAVIKRNKRFPD